MKTPFIAAAALLASTLALALPPGKANDARAARELHERACTACHARMYGGDGSKMYTRDGRQLSNRLEIVQRVASCNATMNSGWFPDDEENVAGWLNDTYYRFDN